MEEINHFGQWGLAYYGLVKKEEKEMESKFGEIYQEYKNRVPIFLPSFKILFAKTKVGLK